MMSILFSRLVLEVPSPFLLFFSSQDSSSSSEDQRKILREEKKRTSPENEKNLKKKVSLFADFEKL